MKVKIALEKSMPPLKKLMVIISQDEGTITGEDSRLAKEQDTSTNKCFQELCDTMSSPNRHITIGITIKTASVTVASP